MNLEIKRITDKVVMHSTENESLETLVARGIRTWVEENVKWLSAEKKFSPATMAESFHRASEMKRRIMREATLNLLEDAAQLNDGIFELQTHENPTTPEETISVDVFAVSINGLQEFLEQHPGIEPITDGETLGADVQKETQKETEQEESEESDIFDVLA